MRQIHSDNAVTLYNVYLCILHAGCLLSITLQFHSKMPMIKQLLKINMAAHTKAIFVWYLSID